MIGRSRDNRQQHEQPLHERHHAAEKLGAAFRGHKSRKETERKKTYESTAARRQQEYEDEVHRERARHVYRPQGKSASGF